MHAQRNGMESDQKDPTWSNIHDGFLWAWKDFDFFDNFALGFCGVLSTRTIGPFVACDCVVAVAAVPTISASASNFVVAGGGAFGPSLRRFLKTFDMLTSRCRTLRGLDSVRRSPAAASCSRETERDRERDCDRAASRLCLVLLLAAFACESKSIGGSGSGSSSSSASDSESDEDVHCGIRNSFLRKSLYCSGSFSENLTTGDDLSRVIHNRVCVAVTHAGCTTSSQNVCIQSRRGLVPSMMSASAVSASGSAICQSTSRSMSPSSRSSRMLRGVASSSSSEDCCTLRFFRACDGTGRMGTGGQCPERDSFTRWRSICIFTLRKRNGGGTG